MSRPPQLTVFARPSRLRDEIVGRLQGAGHDVAVVPDPGSWVSGDPPQLALVCYVTCDPAVEWIAQLRSWSDLLPLLVVGERLPLAARLAAFEKGADDVITGRNSLDELPARVAVWIRRGKVQATRWEVGDLVLDEVRGTVTLKGHFVHLTPKQYSLLIALLRRGGAVVSRDTIRREVWGRTNVDDNLIDVTVSGLRRRIETDSQRLVHTVYDGGYRIAP